MDGALYATTAGNQYDIQNTTENTPTASVVNIDASRVSQIYSEVSTVQPPAFQTLMIIKAWNAAAWTVFKSLNTALELLAFIFTDTEAVLFAPLATFSKYPLSMLSENAPPPCIWYKFWKPDK